ncbi:MAG: YebC/PmpR family DNA-binding transcriptional regulator [Dehalococcoidia bacterium]|nr:YebC/PmpR family DNA-binding transcriptional regulator [Dehalococcoidia bacterium]
MAGHSKWAQIKRQKGAADMKRGAIFTKLAREITIAAKSGLPDPEHNFRLRLAIQHARENNMPAENIERAIKRAMGATDATELHEVLYEGYGPGGAALLIQAMTDNRNRTVAEVRNVLTRSGGSLGEAGSVAWQFRNLGVITVAATGHDPDEIALEAIEAGAEDAKVEGDEVIVYTDPAQLEAVKSALESAKRSVLHAEVSMVPSTPIPLNAKDSEALIRLIDRLEELDDVQQVFTNAELDDAVLSRLG